MQFTQEAPDDYDKIYNYYSALAQSNSWHIADRGIIVSEKKAWLMISTEIFSAEIQIQGLTQENKSMINISIFSDQDGLRSYRKISIE